MSWVDEAAAFGRVRKSILILLLCIQCRKLFVIAYAIVHVAIRILTTRPLTVHKVDFVPWNNYDVVSLGASDRQ